MIFNNSGTFTKRGTEGTTSFNGNLLNNSGTVDVESGTLSLNAGFATQIETGIFNVASGATLDFASNIDTVSEGDVQFDTGTQFLGSRPRIYFGFGTITRQNKPLRRQLHDDRWRHAERSVHAYHHRGRSTGPAAISMGQVPLQWPAGPPSASPDRPPNP